MTEPYSHKQRVTDMYNFLQGKPTRSGEKSTNQPSLTPAQAFAVIEYLCEKAGLLPAQYAMCNVCEKLFDWHAEGMIIGMFGNEDKPDGITDEQFKKVIGKCVCGVDCEQKLWEACRYKMPVPETKLFDPISIKDAVAWVAKFQKISAPIMRGGRAIQHVATMQTHGATEFVEHWIAIEAIDQDADNVRSLFYRTSLERISEYLAGDRSFKELLFGDIHSTTVALVDYRKADGSGTVYFVARTDLPEQYIPKENIPCNS